MSNWLAAALLVEKDPARRDASVHKALRCLDAFLASYPADGGCDEGPGYWDRAGGSLFDCLELLHSASGGEIDVFDRPLIQEIGRYIGRVHIAGPWSVNFADAAAKPGGSASLIFRYGKAIGDQGMTGFGAWLAREQGLGKGAVGGASAFSAGRFRPCSGSRRSCRTEPKEPLARDVWFPGLQVMAARSFEGSTKGLYLAAKGGHNDESHNHNDVGNFIVYADGEPVLIDVGVETYTAKTFSGRRYEIWTMQSAYPQPADRQRRHAEERPRVPGPGRPLQGGRGAGRLSSSTSPRLIRRRQGSRHGSAGSSSSAARESSSRSGTRSRRPAGRSR